MAEQSIDKPQDSKLINEAQSMVSVQSRHASQKHDSAARDSKLSNKDLDNIAEL